MAAASDCIVMMMVHFTHFGKGATADDTEPTVQVIFTAILLSDARQQRASQSSSADHIRLRALFFCDFSTSLLRLEPCKQKRVWCSHEIVRNKNPTIPRLERHHQEQEHQSGPDAFTFARLNCALTGYEVAEKWALHESGRLGGKYKRGSCGSAGQMSPTILYRVDSLPAT